MTETCEGIRFSLWLGLGLGLLNAVLVLVVIARLRVPIQLTVPPPMLPIELQELLRQSAQPQLRLATMPPAQLEQLVLQGVELADRNAELHGPDRFRVARDYVLQQAATQNLAVDERTLALSIEAAVAMRNAALSSQPRIG